MTGDKHEIYTGSEFLPDEPGGTDVYDISDPTDPQYVRTYEGSEYYIRYHEKNFEANTRYIIDGNYHFGRVTFGTDGTMSIQKGQKLPQGGLYSFPRDFYVRGTTAFMPWGIGGNVGSINGIRLTDISDIQNLQELRYISDADHPQLTVMGGIILQDETAYVITSYNADIGGTSDSIEVFTLRDQLYRFYSSVYRGHFFTTSIIERDGIIVNDSNWRYEGVAYETVDANDIASQTVYRFWSEKFKHHFYTISQDERDELIANDPNWVYEGEAYYAYPSQQPNTIPVYRFWSDNFKGHFYTSNKDEKELIEANDPNWRYEGIAWWVKS